MAAHAQAQVQAQSVAQGGGQQGQDGSQSEPAGFTYRNRARRKASEKPHVSLRANLHEAVVHCVPSLVPLLGLSGPPCIRYKLNQIWVHASIGADVSACGLQGASQIRQSFSKRKRGIAQKAYQLHKITDAKASPCLPSCILLRRCALHERSCQGPLGSRAEGGSFGCGVRQISFSTGVFVPGE